MQMDFLKRWPVLALALLLAACSSSSDNTEASSVSDLTLQESKKRLFIGPYRIECVNSAGEVQSCLAFKEDQDEEWRPLFSDIVGFDFLTGFINVIKVDVFSLDNPLDDEDGLIYIFDNPFEDGVFIRELNIGELFNIPLRFPEESIVFDEENGVQSLTNSVFFECAGNLCAMVQSLIEQDMAMVVTMQYQGQSDNPDLVAIPCADAKESFEQSCDTTIGP